MKKLLICLQLILILLFLPLYTFADDYYSGSGNTDVSATIDTDYFSSVSLVSNTGEIGMTEEIVINLLDYMGNPISDHSVRLYIDGDDTGITLVQPSLSDHNGETTGSIKADNPGTYKVMAVDNTYGYDIDIVDFDVFYAVPLTVPSLLTEPAFTKGSTNTVSWTKEFGYLYFAQASRNGTFDSIDSSSGWTVSSQYTFSNLEDGIMYFFRLKKKNIGGGESGWSNVVYSVQDSSAPDITFLSIEKKSSGDIEIKAKIEDNLSLKYEKTFCILTNGSLYECSSTSLMSGSVYTSVISSDDLERDSKGGLLDSYKFCIEASDEAENISRECNIELVLREEEEASPEESENEIVFFESFNLQDLPYLPGQIVDYISSTLNNTQILIFSSFVAIFSMYIAVSILFEDLSVPFIYIYIFFLKLLKRNREFVLKGKVYDSKTKNPVKYSLVKIFSKDGRKIGICVSDRNGDFNASIREKDIRIEVSKNRYIFPSSFVTEKTDYPLQNVYLGRNMKLKNTQVNIVSIPLDKKGDKIFFKLLNIAGSVFLLLTILLFLFGFFFSVHLLSKSLSVSSFVLFLIYLLDILLFVKYLIQKHQRYGYVKDESSNPVEGIDVVFRDSKSQKILYRRVSDIYGRYCLRLEKGSYTIDILNTDYDLTAVEDGREFVLEEIESCTKDLIVSKRG